MNVMDPEDLPELASSRLRLRTIRDADAASLFEIFSDPAVTRYWSSPPLRDDEALHRLLASIVEGARTGTLLQWGITRREDDVVIGTCTLAAIDPVHRRAELGFALGRRHWGQGYASEAAAVVVRHGFETLRLHRITADADPRNAASLRLLERVGFRREGHLRQHYLLNGEAQDAVLFGLLRSEWDR